MYDVAIIGTGPAGLSAAINLKLHNKEIIWFGFRDMSVKVEKSEKIANYPGVPMTSGAELNALFKAQAEELGLEIEDKKVTNIMPAGDYFMLLANNDMYEAKAVLFAIGSVPARGFTGESEFLGRGVSYCATCDGFLYQGKTIAVFCGDKRYEHEVEYLAGVAEKVYLSTSYRDTSIDLPNVELLSGGLREINGDLKVRSIKLASGDNLDVDGVFILRNAVAPATIMPGLELDGPHIAVNRQCETNLAGCYAAGDCTGRPYQITKAVGEGNIAAHAILEYIK